jgi:hypothetical protein
MNQEILPATTLEVDDALATKKAGELMRARGAGIFPHNMSQEIAIAIARLSLAYHLDPMAEELIVYRGKPYLTLRGAMRLANQNPAFEGIECNPATAEERRGFRAGPAEHLWVARVWRRDRRFPVTGYGRCSPDETMIGEGGALAPHAIGRKWSQEMAQKRAKHRALRDAFSLPLPGAADEIDERHGPVIEGTASEVPPITPGQIEAIHAVIGELGLSEDVYRARLQSAFGVRSSKALTRGQASAFLEQLAHEATGSAARPVKKGDRPPGWGGTAVVDEDELMAGIAADVAEHAGEEPRFFKQGKTDERRTMHERPSGVPSAAAAGGDMDRGVVHVPLREDQGTDVDRAEEAWGPPTQQQLDHYASALTRGAQLGLDLVAYEINPTTITADALDALDANLRAAIAANEPPERLAGM